MLTESTISRETVIETVRKYIECGVEAPASALVECSMSLITPELGQRNQKYAPAEAPAQKYRQEVINS